MKRILLTGGGSGGHIFPLLAVAEELKDKPGVELRFFGARDIYADYFKREGIAVSYITAAKLRRYFDWRNLIDFPKLILSFFQTLIKVFWFMPDLAFSKGGSGALPVVWACWFYRVPTIIHESDAVPGLANIISARFASGIKLAFNGAKKYFPAGEVTGNPVRRELLNYVSSDPRLAKEKLKLNPDKPLILVLGGSLGSVRINQFIIKIADKLLVDYQIVHQAGVANYPAMAKYQKPDYQIIAFLEGERYGQLLAASDLVISRSGAGAIFEIAAFGKPSVLVPLPESANDHQRLNAYEYAAAGAAEVIEEPNLLENVVLRTINQILTNKEKYHQMQKAALAFAKPDAARRITEELLL